MRIGLAARRLPKQVRSSWVVFDRIAAHAHIAPADKENGKAPDYRVFAGQIEFGAAWKKTSSAGREYLSVKLDDPSLPAPIYASLVEAEGEALLFFSKEAVGGPAMRTISI